MLNTAASGAAPGRTLLQLTPAADFTPSDGREMDVPAWRINGAIASKVIAAFNAAQPPVIDYEHQTLHKESNGQPAPAAGWMHGLRWIEGRGLFAEVELTQRARDLVQAGEYRYFSPVFLYNKKTGDIASVLMGALTNHPAIAGMEAVNLMAAASAYFNLPNPPETTVTLLEKLLAAIGLPANTTEDAALAACSAHKAQSDAARKALQLDANATADTVTAACTSLRTASASATPDPAKFVPVTVVTELQTNFAALSSRQHARDVEDLIAPALADGRLLPPEETWARDAAKTPEGMAVLTGMLKVRQPVAALTHTQTHGKPPAGAAAGGAGGTAGGLTADELAVAAACGLTPEAYAKGKA
ncbi:phage protease [Diaphorobacter sp. HDW4A]|uniref:phage protease n=1 Tax=Diaphorobacter sp. HDW4A TaxID=2714924 RepID=UPI001F117C0F|nr:phage protease [Diaphorobacter sp. HDW4A]